MVEALILFPGEGRGPVAANPVAKRRASQLPAPQLDPGLRRGTEEWGAVQLGAASPHWTVAAPGVKLAR
mgnify:CR=1 FL=1